MAKGKELTLGVMFKGEINQSLKNALSKLETSVKGLNKNLTTLGKNAGTTGKSIGNISSGAISSTKAITTLGTQAEKTGGAMLRLTDAFKTTAAYGAASVAIYAVTNALRSGAQSIIDYDQGLKNLEAITGAAGFEIAAMGETIKTVARDTKFSTSEAADGMTLLGQAGLTAGESMTAMKDTANLATGTLSDMQTTTDLVSTTIRAFGISATESGRIVDVMGNAVNKSKLTIDKLRTAFNYVAATSSQAGLTIEETAATMMTLANNGLRASTIGTGFRQVLSKMVKPSEKLAASLASVGLNLDDVNPSMVGWQGTLKSLSAILYDTDTKTVNMSKAFGLFGLRGAQAAAVVVKSFVSGDYQSALDRVYEIGTAEEMAAKQAEGLAVKLKNLIDRAGNVAVAFGDAGAANGLRLFLDVTREVLGALETFVGTAAGQVIVQLGAIAGSFKLATVAATGFFSLLMKSTTIQATVMTFRGLATTLSGKTGLAGALATVGASFTAFLTKLNPVTIALGIIAAAVLTYKAALTKSIKDAEQFAVKNIQIVDSLEAYRGAMVSTGERAIKLKGDTDLAKGANDAYIATLQRLIKAHPELTSKIEMSIDAYERNNEVIKEFTSTAHAEKVRALVNLYNEYGESLERSQVWAGYLESLKYGLVALKDDTTTLISKLDGVGDSIIKFSEKAKGDFPIIAGLIKLIGYEANIVTGLIKQWWKADADLLKGSIKYWKEYFLEMGKGSESLKGMSDKQKEVLDTIANGYASMSDAAKKSYGEIKRELEETTDKSKGLTNEEVAYVINAVAKKREAMNSYSHDVVRSVTDATNKMSEAWQAYYDKQDINGKVEVTKTWERAQKRFKDHVEILQKMVDANEISKEQMLVAAKAWWDKELEEYKAKQAKEEGELTKSFDKRQAEYQKYTDKIKSIEEKLAEDIKLLRQADMTDAEKNNDDLAVARQTLADAVKAVAEASTATQAAEALKQVENARAAYGEIVRAANQASELEVKAQEKSTESKKAIKTVELGWFATEQELASAREQVANNVVIENLKAERDLYNKWYGDKADERATKDKTASDAMKTAATEAFAVITALLEELQAKFAKPVEVEVKTDKAKPKIEDLKKTTEDAEKVITRDKSFEVIDDATPVIEDIRNIAEDAGQIIVGDKVYKVTDGATPVIEGIKQKAEETGRIIVDGKEYKVTDGASPVIDDIKAKAEETGKIIVNPKIFKVTDGATPIIEDIRDIAEGTGQIITKDKVYKLSGDGAITAIDKIKTSTIELDTEIQKKKTIEIDVTKPEIKIPEVKEEVEQLGTIVEEEKELNIVSEPAKTGMERVGEVARELLKDVAEPTDLQVRTAVAEAQVIVFKEIVATAKEKVEEPAELNVTTGNVKSATDQATKEIDGWITVTKNKKAEVTVDFKGTGSATLALSEKIAAMKKLLDDLANSTWSSVYTLTVEGMSLLNDALAKLKSVNEKTWTSIHTITVNGIEKLNEAIAKHAELNGKHTTSTHTVKVDGEGSTRKPISEKIAEVKGWLDGLKKKAEETGTKITFSFTGKGSEELPISEKIESIKKKFDDLKADAESKDITISTTFDTEDAEQSLKDLVDEVAAGVRTMNDEVENELATIGSRIAEVFSELPAEWKEIFDGLDGQYKLDFFNFASKTADKGEEFKTFLKAAGDDQGTATSNANDLYAEDLANYKESLNKKDDALNTSADNMKETLDTSADDTEIAAGRMSDAAGTMQSGWTSAIDKLLLKLDELLAKLAEVAEAEAKGGGDNIRIQRNPGLAGVTVTAIDLRTGKTIWTRFEPYREGGIVGMSSGGPTDLTKQGGKIPGYGGGDTIPAMLEKGEYVIRKEKVKEFGQGLFDRINNGIQKFASGGAVGDSGTPWKNKSMFSDWQWWNEYFSDIKTPRDLLKIKDVLTNYDQVYGSWGSKNMRAKELYRQVIGPAPESDLNIPGDTPRDSVRYGKYITDALLAAMNSAVTNPPSLQQLVQALVDGGSAFAGSSKVLGDLYREITGLERPASDRISYDSDYAGQVRTLARSAGIGHIMQGVTKPNVESNLSRALFLIKRSSSVTVKPKARLRAGGKLPGYGGGDTVPAMLEKGEFVIRKEAVKEYGEGMLGNINSMMAGMKVGGIVRPEVPKFAQGGIVGGSSNNLSGQLHTINLNINNQPHKLYGDTDAVNGLVKTLRRAQLITV